MSLSGNWIGHEIRETSSGQAYMVCEIEYNDKPWKMSTFDVDIMEAAEKLQEGDEVTFTNKKSGKYFNLESLNGTEASKKPRGSRQVPPKGAPQQGNRDFAREGRDKAFCGMFNAYLHGITANRGELPEGKELHAAGVRIAVVVKKVMDGDFFKKSGSDSDIPF